MPKLSDSFAKLKESIGSEVSGQTATYLADLGSAVEKAEKALDEVIKESVGRKEKIGELTDQIASLKKDVETTTQSLNDANIKVSEYEPIKAQLDEMKSAEEKLVRDKWNKAQALLTVDQKSPLFDKSQKVVQFFKLPKDAKDVLDIETVKSNLRVFEQYEAAEYFVLPKDETPDPHDKSNKDKQDRAKDTGGSPYAPMFDGFDNSSQT